MKAPTIQEVALAFAKASPMAGQSYEADEPQAPEVRAANLVRCGYVREGDPFGWAGGPVVATIYAEQKGGADDCMPPADYWGRWPVLGRHLPGWYWEWINAAVGALYPCR